MVMAELCHRRESKVTPVTDENAATTGAAATDENDWRVTVKLDENGQVSRAVQSLSAHQVEGEVHKQLGGTVVVGAGDGNELFLYTHSADAATAAQQSVSQLLAGHGMMADFTLERWHPVAEEWEAADLALPATAAQVAAERARLDAAESEESIATGHALFEVRVQLRSHRDSVDFADRLKAGGYSVARRWRFVVVGANNADQAEQFEAAIREQAPDGAEISVEEVGSNLLPFTVFQAAAGSGL